MKKRKQQTRLNEHIKTKFADLLLACVIKPIIIASLYSFRHILAYIYKKSNSQTDFNHTLLKQSFINIYQNRNHGEDYFILQELLESVILITAIDNAYNVRIRDFFREYYALTEKEKFNI